MAGYPEQYPRTGFLLSLIGGILITVVSLLVVALVYALASELSALGYGGAATALVVAELMVGAVLGILIIYGAYQVRSRPASARIWGIGIIVLALVSIFVSSGGFYIGALLALIGGFLAYRWRPPAPSPTGWSPAPGAPPTWSPPPPSGPTPPLAGAAGKFCPYCGASNPAPARFCARCGAGFPG